MKGRSALPRVAFLLGLLVVGGGISGSIWGRALLARVDYFNVERLEVVGTHLVAPDSLLRLAAIGTDRSVWADYTAVEDRLVRHPLIESAQVERSGVHTLRLVIREVEPLALVALPELRPVLADGSVLAIEPAGTALDLPLLTAEAELTAGSAALSAGPALRALQAFAALRALDPGLASVVSDFELQGGETLKLSLVMSQPARRLMLPLAINETLARRVRATLTDLRSRGVPAETIEARYANQIVVRREGS